mmetsp:Transcript_8510/g.18120  ORF Transcript_8510/g.18120 Transcript_8510/m.18120 type:complete len:555 (+) Transcript_8510:62-1726(+)
MLMNSMRRVLGIWEPGSPQLPAATATSSPERSPEVAEAAYEADAGGGRGPSGSQASQASAIASTERVRLEKELEAEWTAWQKEQETLKQLQKELNKVRGESFCEVRDAAGGETGSLQGPRPSAEGAVSSTTAEGERAAGSPGHSSFSAVQQASKDLVDARDLEEERRRRMAEKELVSLARYEESANGAAELLEIQLRKERARADEAVARAEKAERNLLNLDLECGKMRAEQATYLHEINQLTSEKAATEQRFLALRKQMSHYEDMVNQARAGYETQKQLADAAAKEREEEFERANCLRKRLCQAEEEAMRHLTRVKKLEADAGQRSEELDLVPKHHSFPLQPQLSSEMTMARSSSTAEIRVANPALGRSFGSTEDLLRLSEQSPAGRSQSRPDLVRRASKGVASEADHAATFVEGTRGSGGPAGLCAGDRGEVEDEPDYPLSGHGLVTGRSITVSTPLSPRSTVPSRTHQVTVPNMSGGSLTLPHFQRSPQVTNRTINEAPEGAHGRTRMYVTPGAGTSNVRLQAPQGGGQWMVMPGSPVVMDTKYSRRGHTFA